MLCFDITSVGSEPIKHCSYDSTWPENRNALHLWNIHYRESLARFQACRRTSCIFLLSFSYQQRSVFAVLVFYKGKDEGLWFEYTQQRSWRGQGHVTFYGRISPDSYLLNLGQLQCLCFQETLKKLFCQIWLLESFFLMLVIVPYSSVGKCQFL